MKSWAADAAQPNKTTAAITAAGYRLVDRFMQNKGIAAGAL